MNALAEADWGQSQAVLIGAPAGVGKSRLLQEFELQAKLAEIAFGMGQCRAEGLAPLAPLTQALRSLVPLTPPELGERVGPAAGPHGALAGPSRRRSARPSRTRAPSSIAIFGALTEWLQALAQRHTFVLCFEDLQWADAATLEVLNVIIRALSRTRGMVVGSYRSDALSRLSLAFQTVDEGLSHRMDLAPLTVRARADAGAAGAARPAGPRGLRHRPALHHRGQCLLRHRVSARPGGGGRPAARGRPVDGRWEPGHAQAARDHRGRGAGPAQGGAAGPGGAAAPAGPRGPQPGAAHGARAGGHDRGGSVPGAGRHRRAAVPPADSRAATSSPTTPSTRPSTTAPPSRCARPTTGAWPRCSRASGTTTRTWTGWWATTSPAPPSLGAPSSR